MAAPKQPQQSVSHSNGSIARSGTGGVPGHRASFLEFSVLCSRGASFAQRVREAVTLIVNVPPTQASEGWTFTSEGGEREAPMSPKSLDLGGRRSLHKGDTWIIPCVLIPVDGHMLGSIL